MRFGDEVWEWFRLTGAGVTVPPPGSATETIEAHVDLAPVGADAFYWVGWEELALQIFNLLRHAERVVASGDEIRQHRSVNSEAMLAEARVISLESRRLCRWIGEDPERAILAYPAISAALTMGFSWGEFARAVWSRAAKRGFKAHESSAKGAKARAKKVQASEQHARIVEEMSKRSPVRGSTNRSTVDFSTAARRVRRLVFKKNGDAYDYRTIQRIAKKNGVFW